MRHWEKVTIVGLGLLGGSLGLAIKKLQLAERVDGVVRRSAAVAECTRLGVVDHATRDVLRGVEGADLVVLCTPLAQMKGLVEQMLPALKPGVIITDVGSAKSQVVQDLEALVAGAGGCFVGSHPMAGSEKMGVSAARADLFAAAVCVVTPTPQAKPEAVQQIEDFWKALGSRTLKLSPDLHDELVSRSSHLPHVVAFELANYVLSPLHPKEQAMLCATGFRDTTRIASSSPEMWRDIVLANRGHLSRVLGVFIEGLQEFQHSLNSSDAKAIEEFFQMSKKRRDSWSSEGNSPE